MLLYTATIKNLSVMQMQWIKMPNWSQNNKTDDHKSSDALNGYNCDKEWGSDFDDDDEGTNDQS